MKGDDDTFVRVDAIINEAKKVPENRSLYIGNINYYHKPLRSGKWAVAYEVLLKPSLSYITIGYYSLPGDLLFDISWLHMCTFHTVW